MAAYGDHRFILQASYVTKKEQYRDNLQQLVEYFCFQLTNGKRLPLLL